MAGFGMLAAWFVACAGEDIPPIDNDLRGALADGYGGAAQVGSGGGAGGAGSGNAGSGNAGSANAGSANAGSGNPGGGAGGGEPVGNAGSGGGGVCDAYEDIFVAKCGNAGCHNDGSINGAFAGEAPPLAADLVNSVSSRGDACGVLVDPAALEESLILTMVTGEADPSACFPALMPLGGDNLTPDEIACIEDWLTQFGD